MLFLEQGYSYFDCEERSYFYVVHRHHTARQGVHFSSAKNVCKVNLHGLFFRNYYAPFLTILRTYKTVCCQDYGLLQKFWRQKNLGFSSVRRAFKYPPKKGLQKHGFWDSFLAAFCAQNPLRKHILFHDADSGEIGVCNFAGIVNITEVSCIIG